MVSDRMSAILDPGGKPFVHKNGKPRPELVEALAKFNKRSSNPVQGTYDAARNSDELKNYWANADAYDADSSHSSVVRGNLVRRSRYEIGNNGYADGIAQTYATHVVGIGPALRMQTGSVGFNRLVEAEWYRWNKAVQLRRKLWCMCHAKHGDGEGLGVLRKNPRVKHPIPLDIVLYETEQCHTPMLPFSEPGYIDGIKFDEFGNPEWYDFLKQHPGSNRVMRLDVVPERVKARRVRAALVQDAPAWPAPWRA
jgi:capsid protein